MATDDDKQVPEPDPWAGLDSSGAEDAAAEDAAPEDFGEDFTFAFDRLKDAAAARDESSAESPADPFSADPDFAEPDSPHLLSANQGDDRVVASIHEEPSDSDGPAFESATSLDHGHRDGAADDIPLVVFPPPDVEITGSEVVIGTERSDIISMPNAVGDSGEEDFDGHDAAGDGFDDNDIAHEMGLLDAEGEAIAAEALASGDDFDGAADFGEPVNEAHSDDMSFNAGLIGGASPFADSDEVEPVADAAERWPDDPASIPLNTAVAATGAAGAALAMAGDRPAAAKKKGSGLGQMVGVVLGGLMALPITYAILIWGFQKDPFKLGKQVPSQLAFLLPQKLQPGYKPPRKADAGPRLDAAPSLDDLPSADEPMPTTPEPAATIAAESAESESTEPTEPTGSTEPTEPAEPIEPTKTAPMKTEALAGTSTEPAASAEPTEPAESDKAASDAAGESVAAAVAAAPAMAADSSLAAALPKPDSLPGLDALMADAGVAAVASVPAAIPAALPPLDLTGVETAAERAADAFEALNAATDPASPDRDRLLVAWYKRLARLSEELVRLETSAADSGRPLSPTPAPASDLLDSICVSDAAVADLDRLGGMWLTSQKRRADGVSLIVTLGPSRQVGPYWSTRAMVSGAELDGTDRTMAIISRFAPPIDMGERVMVSGVMFDGDAIWVADMRPIVPPPSSESGQE